MKGYVRGLRGDDVEHITCAFFSAHSYHLKLNDGDEVMQIDSTCSWKPKLSTIIKSSMVTMWMGDCYVLGFAPALRFLQSNFVQTTKVLLLRQKKSRSPVCLYTHAKRSHMQVKDPLVHVSIRWIMETTITQHTLKASET